MLLVRRRDPGRRDRAGVSTRSILTVGFALLFWVFLIAPNLHLSGLSVPRQARVGRRIRSATCCSWPRLIRFAVAGGQRAPAFYLLVASIVALLAVDCAYNYLLLARLLQPPAQLDVGWIAYFVLWGAAALHPSMLDARGARGRHREAAHAARAWCCSRSPA